MGVLLSIWPAIFIGFGLLIALINIIYGKKPVTIYRALEVVLLWQLVCGFGLFGILGAAGHVLNADAIAKSIGWPTGSPFQTEVGIANLAFGILGLLCYFKRDGFWLATILGEVIFFMGAGVLHIYQMYAYGNFAPNNAGLILYFDIFYPVVILFLYALYKYMGGKPRSGPTKAGE